VRSRFVRNWCLVLVAVVTAGFLVATGGWAEESGELERLLQLLVKRGMITLDEARAVQAEHDRRAAEAAAPKPEAADATTQTTPPEPVAKEVSIASAGATFEGVENLKIGTLAYLSYQNGANSSGDYSQFLVKRVYLDIRKQITPYFSARMTPDAHQEGDGDIEVRFTYAYGQFNWKGSGLLQKPYIEFGVAHMPWIDFEEHINRFRMQDTMFMERNGLFNSADIGVLFGANLGPELDEEYRGRVDNYYAGRWGSFGVGVYNGGGYHAVENNDGKALEGRLTLRPMPDAAPGLQFSVFGVTGDGNAPDDPGATVPEWDVLAGMLSYESPRLVLTAQYEQGSGNQKGNLVGPDGRALDHDGYSLFTEVRLDRDQKWSLIGRYDRFEVAREDPLNDVSERWIAGIAWRFFKGNYWLLDYDRVEYSLPGRDTEHRVQLTLQVKY